MNDLAVTRQTTLDELPLALTVNEYIALLNRPRASAYDDVKKQRVASFRLGRRIYIPRAAVIALLKDAAR